MNMSLTKSFKLKAAALLITIPLLVTGCVGGKITPTGVGAVGGAIVGGVIGDSALGAALGGAGGGVIGNFFEPKCRTEFNSNVSRGVNGDSTAPWTGSEKMKTKCNYSGSTPPENLKAPAHLKHLGR